MNRRRRDWRRQREPFLLRHGYDGMQPGTLPETARPCTAKASHIVSEQCSESTSSSSARRANKRDGGQPVGRLDLVVSRPEVLQKWLVIELARWGKVVRDSDIHVE